jgi:hypothetical protein
VNVFLFHRKGAEIAKEKRRELLLVISAPLRFRLYGVRYRDIRASRITPFQFRPDSPQGKRPPAQKGEPFRQYQFFALECLLRYLVI